MNRLIKERMFSRRSALLARMNVCAARSTCAARLVERRWMSLAATRRVKAGKADEIRLGGDGVCVRACVSARAPLHRSTCTVSLLHPSRYGRPLARSRPVSFLFLARWLPVPFSYWLSCPLVFSSPDSFYDSGPISWLAIGFTLLYCVLTLFAYAIAVYFVLFRWSFQILNFGFDSSPEPHILLVNLAIPPPTAVRLLKRRWKYFHTSF